MDPRQSSTPQDVLLLRDESADPWARAGAVTAVAADHLRELEPSLAVLLDHDSDELRGAAVSALVGRWAIAEYVPAAIGMLRVDPSHYAREDAAAALGAYVLQTPALEQRILRALAEAVLRDPEPLVVTTAYFSLVRVLAPERKTSHIAACRIDRDRDVDWTLLAPYLPA